MKLKLLVALSILIMTMQAGAADFTIQLQPANNSVSDPQVSSISNTKVDGLGSLATKSTITNSEVADNALSSSKISNFANDVLSSISSLMNNYLLKSEIKAMTITKLSIVGPNTYFTPNGVKFLRVKMVGGGGGGCGMTLNVGYYPGDFGGDTSFNSIVAKGGSGGLTSMVGGVGGSGGAGVAALRISGSQGNPGSSNVNFPGGSGGNSPFFAGAGPGGVVASAGGSGTANSGGGGGGAGGSTNGAAMGCSGGGSGEYVELIIENPANSYQYTVGSSGVSIQGTRQGGFGGSGVIIVEEHYQ